MTRENTTTVSHAHGGNTTFLGSVKNYNNCFIIFSHHHTLRGFRPHISISYSYKLLLLVSSTEKEKKDSDRDYTYINSEFWSEQGRMVDKNLCY